MTWKTSYMEILGTFQADGDSTGQGPTGERAQQILRKEERRNLCRGEIICGHTCHRKEFELYSECHEMPVPELSFLWCVFCSKSHSCNWVEDGWQGGTTGSRDYCSSYLEETGLKVCKSHKTFFYFLSLSLFYFSKANSKRI